MPEPASNATEFSNNQSRRAALKQLTDIHRLAASNVDSPIVIELDITDPNTTDTTPALEGVCSDTDATVVVLLDGTAYTATNDADGTWSIADATVSALAVGTHDVAIVAYSATNVTLGVYFKADAVTITS